MTDNRVEQLRKIRNELAGDDWLPLREKNDHLALGVRFDPDVFDELLDIREWALEQTALVLEANAGPHYVTIGIQALHAIRHLPESLRRHIESRDPGVGTRDSALSSFRQGYGSATSTVNDLQMRNMRSAFSPKGYANLVRIHKQAEGLLDHIKDMSEMAGLRYHAGSFYDAEKKHRADATVWAIVAACVAGVVLVSVAAAVLYGAGAPLTHSPWWVGANLSHFGARAAWFSTLSFMLVACVRNFRSSRHNAVVNAFRKDAIQTLVAFKDRGTGVLDEKSLLQVASEIFAPRDTGWGDPQRAAHAADLASTLISSKKH